jgi:hypothetical protein
MDISDGATCRTLACRCYNFQSEFCVGFQPFVEANAPLLHLPFCVIPFIGSYFLDDWDGFLGTLYLSSEFNPSRENIIHQLLIRLYSPLTSQNWKK